MPHIDLPEGVPGIVSLLLAYPDTAQHLNGLAEEILCTSTSLTRAERELIATRVSAGNECEFCTSVHAAVAREHFADEAGIVDAALQSLESAALDDKLRALLRIADKVRVAPRSVSEDDVARARAAGADDRAIHDTVLIAAAFCMYNRYVDGLATLVPADDTIYAESGRRLASDGYLLPSDGR